MEFALRWYGTGDSVLLEQIRQVPGITGIVSAIYDIEIGEVWPPEKITQLKDSIVGAGFQLSVIESVPVHEDIKLGLKSRDRYIENFIETLQNLSQAGVEVVCYNFMPVFDWTRSAIHYHMPDGSTSLAYEEEVIKQMDLYAGGLSLPGWAQVYTPFQLKYLLEQYEGMTTSRYRSNLEYFIRSIMPAAERLGMKLAIHPDDPPWQIFGLPRIVSNQEDLENITKMYGSKSNGLCICSGSLGANPENDVPEMIRYFGHRGVVNFVHARNIKVTGYQSFIETAHVSSAGSIDMCEIVSALVDIQYQGPIRPDHGRMIWGETGRPGYGLYDRALGAQYLIGLYEALSKKNAK